MALDIKARSLPKGDLVNKEGRACRISTQTSKMYCGGSRVGYCNTKGYCGPLDGENCKACKIVQDKLTGMYKKVYEETLAV